MIILLHLLISRREEELEDQNSIQLDTKKEKKKSQNPIEEHWNALYQIFGYLSATKEYGIRIGGEEKELTGYVDSDFSGDFNDCKSTSGCIFFLNNGPVVWSSKKQPVIALFTTEAEFIAACLGERNQYG